MLGARLAAGALHSRPGVRGSATAAAVHEPAGRAACGGEDGV